MSGVFGRLLVLVGLLIALGTAPVWADSQVGNSVTITAVVEPVRYVLVDDHDSIKQIISNTPLNVVPRVYKNSYQSVSLPLSAGIDHQYTAILAHVNTRHDGVIYTRPTVKPLLVSSWLKKLQ